MMIAKQWWVFLAAGFLATACATTPPVEESPEEEEAREVEETLSAELPGVLVEPEWLEERLGHEELLILHVGMEREEWEEGHIPGQIYLDYEEIVVGDFEVGFLLPPLEELRESFVDVGVDDQKAVVLTGDLDGLLASRAFFSLEALGRKEGVALLQGGLEQWREDGRAISWEPVEAERGSFTASGEAEMVLEAEDVLEILEDPGHHLVDARPEQEYSGATAGQGVERAGHIPGATNIFWKNTLEEEDRPLLKPREEIRRIYGEAGISEDAVLVAYCRTGMQASFGYFLGRLQERDVLIYDGSYVDWASNRELPITSPEEQ